MDFGSVVGNPSPAKVRSALSSATALENSSPMGPEIAGSDRPAECLNQSLNGSVPDFDDMVFP